MLFGGGRRNYWEVAGEQGWDRGVGRPGSGLGHQWERAGCHQLEA